MQDFDALSSALKDKYRVEEMTFDAHLTFHLAEPYALAGETETALQLLADAVERGFIRLTSLQSTVRCLRRCTDCQHSIVS